eukprot:c32312_g1_i1.p1 GENE.c32312_g1_i1~~c32312_g1_i1.p1  ORF type:complete len:478 (-),score=72.54 c32312_g1_i1:113-1546(-)
MGKQHNMLAYQSLPATTKSSSNDESNTSSFAQISLAEVNSMIVSNQLPGAVVPHFNTLMEFLKSSVPSPTSVKVSGCSFDTHFTTQSACIDGFTVRFRPSSETEGAQIVWANYKLVVRAQIELVNGDDATFIDCQGQAFASKGSFDISSQGLAKVTSLKLRDTIPGVYRLGLHVEHRSDTQGLGGPCLFQTGPFRIFSKRKQADLSKFGLGEVSIDDWPAFCSSVPKRCRSDLKQRGSRIATKLKDLAVLPEPSERLRPWVEKAAKLIKEGSGAQKKRSSEDCDEDLESQIDESQPKRARFEEQAADVGRVQLLRPLEADRFLETQRISGHHAAQLESTVLAVQPFSVPECSFQANPTSGVIEAFHLRFEALDPTSTNWSEYTAHVGACQPDESRTTIPMPFFGRDEDSVSFPISQGVCIVHGLRMRMQGFASLKISLTNANTEVVLEYTTLAFEVVPPMVSEFDWLVEAVDFSLPG